MIFKSIWIWQASGTLTQCLMTTHFELFYTFKVLAKTQGFLVQWPHVRAQYLLMFPFSLWIFILLLFIMIFFSRVLHDTNSFFGRLCFFLRLFHRALHGASHVFFVSLFFMFFFCAFCLLGFLLLEKTLSAIYFLFIVLFIFVARA